MTPRQRIVAVEFARFASVLVVAVAMGAAVGFGLSAASGDPPPAPPLRPAATGASSPTTTATSATPATNGATSATPQAGVSYVVSSTVFTPPTTAAGRARVAVRLRLRNRTDRAVKLGSAVLVFGSDRVARDARATEAAGPLDRTVPAHTAAFGELRFETAGQVTARLAKVRAARLLIGGHSLPLVITR